MRRNALLINPGYNSPIRNEMYPTGALTLLQAVTKEEGWHADIIQCVSDRIDHDGVLEQIRTKSPSVIGISVTTFQTRPAKRLTHKIKTAFPEIRVVAGGAHISSIGKAVLDEFPNVDYFVVGEGENAWRSILQSPPIHRCVIQGTMADLNQLPLPDYTGIDLDKYFGALPPSAKPSMFLMASRGCPFQCVFCSKAVYGSKVRYKSPERVMQEIKNFSRMGIKEVFFQDDTLNLNHDWFNEILERIIFEKLNLSFKGSFRANSELINIGLLKKVRKAGFWLIFYGVESGNQEMLTNMGKGLNLHEIERAFKLTHESGLKTEASFIIGLPWETRQTIEQTWKFYRKIKPFWAGFSIAIPFPGTKFYTLAKESQLIEDKDFDGYFADRCVIRSLYMDREEIDSMAAQIGHRVQMHNSFNLALCPTRMRWAIRRYYDFKSVHKKATPIDFDRGVSNDRI